MGCAANDSHKLQYSKVCGAVFCAYSSDHGKEMLPKSQLAIHEARAYCADVVFVLCLSVFVLCLSVIVLCLMLIDKHSLFVE